MQIRLRQSFELWSVTFSKMIDSSSSHGMFGCKLAFIFALGYKLRLISNKNMNGTWKKTVYSTTEWHFFHVLFFPAFVSSFDCQLVASSAPFLTSFFPLNSFSPVFFWSLFSSSDMGKEVTKPIKVDGACESCLVFFFSSFFYFPAWGQNWLQNKRGVNTPFSLRCIDC